MKTLQLPPHGGNIYYFTRLLKKDPLEIIDLSSSVNPLIRKFLKLEEEEIFKALELYPDPEAEELKEILSHLYQVKRENFLLGNGSYELLKLLLLNLPSPSVIFLLEPTFIGYRKILSQRKDLNLEWTLTLNTEEKLWILERFLKGPSQSKVVIFCNPNNPTGNILKKDSLIYFLTSYPNVIFIIDEAFIEFSEEDSLIQETNLYPNLFVLRSLTKFFGLAGARMGYLVSSHPILEKIKNQKEPWSLNTLSQVLAKKILLNQEVKKKSLKYFLELKRIFEKELEELPINWFKSVTNFYLLRDIPKGEEFFFWLLKEKGILIRSCYNFYGLTARDFRVSLKDRESLEIFISGLREWLKRF